MNTQHPGSTFGDGIPARVITADICETSDTPFAAFLFATLKLKYLGIRWDENTGRCLFQFADPDTLAPNLRVEFAAGAAVSANALFEAQRILRTDIANIKEKNNHANSPYGRRR